jgi:single-stranded-DNA-specific exonuclease
VDKEFNPGVVGLAASRMTEVYYRPAIVGHRDEETTRCSCRSIPELHITDALDECSELLIQHGGHAAAAGFTVANDHYQELVSKLNGIALGKLQGMDLRHKILADVEISLNELNPSLLPYLEQLEPTGYGNKEAIFVSRKLRVTNKRLVGSDGSHLKLSLTDGKIAYDAIAFRFGHLFPELPIMIDAVYSFEKNEFNGRENLQLKIRDIHPAGTPG